MIRSNSCCPYLRGNASWLCDERLQSPARMGHEVKLFASGDSRTSAPLVPPCPTSLWRYRGESKPLPQRVHTLELVFRDLSRFEVVHFHCDYLHFPLPSASFVAWTKDRGVWGRTSFVRPVLPPFLKDLEIRYLRVGAATLDLPLTRHGEDASVKLARQAGGVDPGFAFAI